MIKWYLKKLKEFYQQDWKNMIIAAGIGVLMMFNMVGIYNKIKKLREKKKPKLRLID